jgi:beta-lactamase class A
LGTNFPLTLTSESATVDGKLWDQVAWQTAGRHGTGWLPASALRMSRPSGAATASFDALDTDLAAYLAKLGAHVGVEVFDVTRGVTYTYNAGREFLVASSMKVPIMLTLLAQLETKGRQPTSGELALLTTMIENSNNDSASALYEEIGYQSGIAAFMRRLGISGLAPASPTTGWGWSVIMPATMVSLLARLHAGTILTAADRALALRLMEHVESDQQVGVGDSSPDGATVALKDGWVPGPDGLYVMNSSGIVTVGGETYIAAVYTTDDNSLEDGFDIVRHVCDVIGDRLVGTD